MAKKYVDKLNDRRVIVFGSTSGIGYAVAEASLEFGAHVFVTGSRQDKLDKAISSLKEAYPESSSKVTGATLDLSDGANLESNIKALFDMATEQKKHLIHHVVFTAGDMLTPVNLDTVTVDDVMAPMHVRRTAPFILAKVVKTGGFMSQETPNEASLTFTAGTTLHKPMLGWSVLASLFINIEAMRRGMAIDMAPHIRVNLVTPGAIDTELLRTRFTSQEALDGLKNKTLTKSFPGPEEAAEPFLFIMRSRYITGEEIILDGGASLS